MAKKEAKELPEFLKNIEYRTLEEFQKTTGISLFRFGYNVNQSQFAFTAIKGNDVDWVNLNDSSIEADNAFPLGVAGWATTRMLYVEEDGTCWKSNLVIRLSDYPEYDWSTKTTTWVKPVSVELIDMSEWALCDKFTQYDALIQGEEKVREILSKLNPDLIKYIDENPDDAWNNIGYYAMCPQLETLKKAGFAFANQFLVNNKPFEAYRRIILQQTEIEAFNRLCKRGTDLKEIFTVPPVVYNTLRTNANILIWDELRKLGKKLNNPNEVKRLSDMYSNQRDIKRICKILKRTYDGKPIFTPDTLLKYLDRVDIYEAIDTDEALELLDNYLLACQRLGKKPVTDGDSLKREHDVTMRLIRNPACNDEVKGAIKKVGDALKPFAYSDANYFIRPIESFDDLLDEGNQQETGFATTYPKYIAKKQRFIFVMRSTEDPKKSVATVELYDDFSLGAHCLRQGRTMTDDAQLDFLERWMEHVERTKASVKIA